MKNQHIHQHYHLVKTDYKLLRYFVFGILIVSWSCGFLFSAGNKKICSSVSGWISHVLASYATILNNIVSIFGWKKSFLWFWYLHVGWGSIIYFGIPVLAVALLTLILKREKLALLIILALYIWHHGLSFLIERHRTWYFYFATMLLLCPWLINILRKNILNDLIYKEQQSPKKVLQNREIYGSLPL